MTYVIKIKFFAVCPDMSFVKLKIIKVFLFSSLLKVGVW